MKYSLFLCLLAFAACQPEKPRAAQAGGSLPAEVVTLEAKAPAPLSPQTAEAMAPKPRETEVPPPVAPPSPPAAQPPTEAGPSKLTPPKAETPAIALPGHENWDALLRKYVSAEGKVNYKGFIADKAALQAYLDALAAHPVDKSWAREEKLAYWINAYNAFTIKLIVDNYPVSSIMDIHGGKPWSVKWIKLGEKTYSLDNIENDIIRPQFQEPRIHFAVNCAARSCPPLLNRAWTADNLNRYLEQQARSFINNPQYNKITSTAVEISKIFEWYAGDFGDIIGYLNTYSEIKIGKGARVSYKDYDWALNGQ